MEAQAIEALTRRVERMERECRWWRRAGLATLLGLVGMMVGGAASYSAGELKIERLLIQDGDDARKGIVLSAKDGSPSLMFFDEDQEKIFLSVSAEGVPSLSFTEAGRPRMMLGLSRSGTPVLNLNDENQRRRVSVGIFPQVGPMMSVLDENNTVIFKAP